MKITKAFLEHSLLLWSLNRQTRSTAMGQTVNSVIFQTLIPICHFKKIIDQTCGKTLFFPGSCA